MTSTQLIALITGASRANGLGFETARQLGQKGYTVFITARELFKAESLAKNYAMRD
jgi:short-subunit dehydrogenase